MLCDHNARSVRKPLAFSSRTHLKTVRYRASKAVNGAGNLICVYPPKINSNNEVGTNASFLMFSNSEDYIPAGPSDIPAASANWDFNFAGASGQGLTAGHFTASKLIAAHAEIYFSGVSALNKQGKVYLAESKSNYWVGQHQTNDLQPNENIYANRYTIANLIKFDHVKELDMATMNNNTKLEYNYIDADSYSSWPQDPTILPALTHYYDSKAMVLVVQGAAANTEVIIDYTVTLELRPAPQHLNTYPCDYADSFFNPDPICKKLEQLDNVTIRVHNGAKTDLGLARTLGKA
jgi:hypothetical protein